MTGIEAFLEILHAGGVRHIFGNPGTTELPLNDALVNDQRFQYIFGLHEIPVLAMADGFAMASGQVAVANVHISCGLGNAMGMLYNAHREGTPLLLTAGQQDRRLAFDDPVLVGDLVSVARPWTKWACEVNRVQDLPNATRRAMQIALTPPTGPVFLALPVDLQMEVVDRLDLSGPTLLNRRVRPAREALQRAAELLRTAKKPAILAGSRIVEADACQELTRMAELLGAPVLTENGTAHGRLPMSADHPLYRGPLPLWAPDIRQRLAEFDMLFVTGMNLLRMYLYHEPPRPIPQHARLIHLDNDAAEIGRNYPLELGVWGDLKTGLGELAEFVASSMSTAEKEQAAERQKQWAAVRQRELDGLHKELDVQRSHRPMTALTLMSTLARCLPKHGVVVEEAVTTHHHLLEKLGVFRDPTGHIAHRGWALGWGLGCALGVKLAWPGRPVVGLLGDGAALYGIQGLWSAAHHRIPVTFIIANNVQYKILKKCGEQMPLPRMAENKYLAMDLVDPTVDFVTLAKSLGVDARRIDEPDDLEATLRDGWDRPRVLDVALAS